MTRRGYLIIALVLFYAVHAFGSGSPPQPKFDRPALKAMLEYYSLEELTGLLSKMDRTVDHLSTRKGKYKKVTEFTEYTYYYVHRKFLRQYKEFSSLNLTIGEGQYDCLTATALYSYFFTELGIPFSVVENNYHIYVLVFPGTQDEVLIETTDPKNGFVTDDNIIDQLKIDYAKANYNSMATVKLDFDLNNLLEGNELIGLLLYNESVKNVNMGRIDEALELALQSQTYYSGERVAKLISWLKAEKLYASI